MWALSTCGAQAGSSKRHKGEQVEGVKGLKSLGWAGLGVRYLCNRMAFLACGVTTAGKN